MGSFDWARETAQELIDEFGVASTLRLVGQQAPVDPAKPWRVSAATPLDVTAVVCFLSTVGETLNYQENGQTRTGRMLGLVAAPLDYPPTIGAQVFASTAGAQVWTIKALREHAPDGVPIMWELVLDL